MIDYGFPYLGCQLTHDFIPHSTHKYRFKKSLAFIISGHAISI